MAFGLWSVLQSLAALAQGNTKEEALENVKDAINLCLEVRGDVK